MDGKVALITGVARGQGRSHALTLAREGADIVGIDCPPQFDPIPYGLATPEDLRETVAQVEALDRRIVAVEGDVRDQGQLDSLVERAIAELGKIDVCVANAGLATLAPFWEMTDDEWNTVVDTNLSGVWRTVKAVTPQMIEREEGSIILISSVSGVEGAPGLSNYVAAKHGVLGLMKCVCLELGPKYGIRCNSILPGPIDTEIIKWPGMLDFMAGGEGLGEGIDLNESCKAWGAVKGIGLMQPRETSNAVLFLASDESAGVSGLEMLVDAGHRTLPGLNMEAMAAAAEAAEATA
jgi:SDR family mycofactocin-dependent oxidoreductase